jgi:hypothetical protein
MATATAVKERYGSAVHAKSLVVDERTALSDSDVLAAIGFADRALTDGKRWARVKPGEEPKQEPVRPAPLAAALARLFAGDNQAAHVLVRVMAHLVYERSWVLKVKVTRHVAFDMARACLAWSRNGACKPCGGHGKTLIPGTKTHSDHDCQTCKGTGKMAFETHFRHEHRELARWLVVEVEREMGHVWPEAARALARDMDL